MKIVVRPARLGDVEAVAALLAEMDDFYGGVVEEPLAERHAQVEEALFGPKPAACALLAWSSETLVGIASYSFLWPAVGLSRSLYLKELYVAGSARRTGIGKLLMAELFDIADKHRCSRVEWTTDADNQAAQEFYEELGNQPHPSKIFYRLER